MCPWLDVFASATYPPVRLLSGGSGASSVSRRISSPRGATEPDEGVAGCSQRLCCAFLVTLPSFPSSRVEDGVSRLELSERAPEFTKAFLM